MMNIEDIDPAALAKLLDITPETHRQCFYRIQSRGLLPELPIVKHDGIHYQATFPALNTHAADEVFAVPLLYWCAARGMEPEINYRNDEHGPWESRCTDDIDVLHGEHEQTTITLALLHAAYAACVPEIVALVEGETT